MKFRNSSSQHNQAGSVSRGCKGFNHPLLQSCLLYISSALSIAVSISPAHATEPFPASINSSAQTKTLVSQEDNLAQTLEQIASLLRESSEQQLDNRLNKQSDAQPLEFHSAGAAALTPLADAIAQADSTPVPAPPSAEPAAQPASDSPRQPQDDSWQFSLEPYFFVPFGVQVDAAVAGRSASIDYGLGDILSLDRVFDFGLRFEAQKNRLGLIFDGFYVFAKNSGSLGVTFPEGSLQRFGINFPIQTDADAKLTLRQGVIDLAASYRVVDTTFGEAASANSFPRLFVAPIVGIRTNIISQELKVSEVRALNRSLSVNESFSFSRTTVEPLIGVEIGFNLSRRWGFDIRGDVSGFNINAERDLTWNLFIKTLYRLSPSVALQLGYRLNSFDFEDGSGLRRTKIDLRQNGLLLSVIFGF